MTAAAAEPIEVGMSDEDSPETAPSRPADDFPAAAAAAAAAVVVVAAAVGAARRLLRRRRRRCLR